MKTLKTLLGASAALMSVTIMASERKVWPEAIADSLSSDGSGYVDLGYRYHISSFPKTARIVCDLYDGNWGKGRAPGPTISGTYPRTVFGYHESSASVSIARYNGGKGEFVYNGGNSGQDCGRLDTTVTVDYINNCASWKFTESPNVTRVYNNVTAPISDSPLSYYLFANHHHTYLWNGIFSFKNLRIYELTESGEEVLARDYIPCVDNGKFGVYDKVSCEICPVQNDTNCFSAANVRWRLTVGDQVAFVTGNQNVDAPSGADVDGWMLVRDSDGSLIAHGEGDRAAFTMPETGVTLHWVRDEEVEAASVCNISAPTFVSTLILKNGSLLTFGLDGVLTVSENIVLPEEGCINISCPEISAAGVYVLVRGNTSSIELSSLSIQSLPDGVKGAFERRGDSICLRVCGVSTALASMPDKIIDSLTSDGAGYVDLGYRYRVSSFPKTARIECDFYDVYWGYGRSPGPVTKVNPRVVFGYEDTGSNCSIARWSDGSGYIVSPDANSGGSIGRYESSIVIDYMNMHASWKYSESGNDLNFEGVPTPTLDSERSYYLFALNTFRSDYLCRAIFSFKNLRIYEYSEGNLEMLAHDFVPAVKDGLPCVYDKMARAVLPVVNDTNGFVMAGAKWPTDVFSEVTQDFPCARTQSFRPVAVPEFAPERTFTFIADGSVELKRAVATATMVAYAVDGSIISTKTQSNLNAGDQLEVEVGTASKTVLTLTGVTVPEVKSVIQEFDVASVQSCDGVAFRRTGKHECEFMLPADATISFSVAVDEIFADDYSDVGELTGEKRLYGHVDAGEAVDVDFGDGAYRVLRVKLSHPRFRLIVR